MKAKHLLALFLSVLLALSGCTAAPSSSAPESSASSETASETVSSEAASKNEARTLTDSLGNTAELPENPRIVALYGSFAQCWLLSGGTLVGVTEDAAEEHGIETGGDVALVGSVKEPNLEQVAALAPDYVLLSADLSAHMELDNALSDMQLPHGYFRMDTFADYDKMMQAFCALNDEAGERYAEYVTVPAAHIEEIKAETVAAMESMEQPRVLLLRAYSTGVKAKTDDNLAGVLLDELGAYNIAYDSPSLLEDLSVEEIIMQDPDFIFVTTMGSEKSAKAYMEENITNSPAWSELAAVKNGRYIFLPKDLFHYKPLNRWDESYAYLADCLLGKTE